VPEFEAVQPSPAASTVEPVGGKLRQQSQAGGIGVLYVPKITEH
jgi:hypothetical protein